MTIGELLKEYRITQGKKQKEFTNDGVIVSQSYYSKVEKNAHRITADSLIDLLHYNNIPVWDFFSRLNIIDDMNKQEIDELNKTMAGAFYSNDTDRLYSLITVVDESNLSDKDKQEEILLIQACLELMKKPDEKPDIELRNKIRDKIFNIPNFNYQKISLFCNFMKFYDLESNKMISRKIIDQHINTKDSKMQAALLAIIVNILAFSVRDGKLQETEYFINSGDQIKTQPELVFYKSAFYFFKNLINYQLTHDQESYENSKKTQAFLLSIGMEEYSKVLGSLLEKYK
ncbi:hypothetical protein FC52_GL000978 [Lactobacillus pasteurii DSM 23907 = CRBIP 24.76]|uniref:HTH-type transcriptional regulator Rgg C-terminal domain-containing protein n=1 Tax=Lactobacillus pasteurii DSM 23907 = CRBIP 24.76 TaxID=1423790 RepID=I7LAQ1_9LACO|nr:Rgg/GadR/MutR family transcriptional regulator [Lactobacillus pasteurii]KRK08241.1 hypothetical protein FC52_GL000978 [Lactobacillus pasteurii DSM 23907 = CRBIP 24.76]TDG77361.1 hypothetical protein C5L33_000804 [Lactobacillus pasteurii]CCI84906.1 Putative uncharacterized protein [Lactobacillus pasteurii DSM 23907 = CRBIP 24.76]